MSLRSVSGFFAAVGLAAAAVFVFAAPAAAHDQLVGSDPGADATVAAVPEQVVLTLSAEVLADEGAAVVEVTDASGALVSTGDPVVAGVTVTQSLDAAAAVEGEFEVVWKVVSSDGHPIDGAFVFTVATATPSPTASPSPTVEQSATAEPTPTVSAVPAAPPAEQQGVPVFVWAIIGVLVIGVLGAIVYLLVVRARGAGATGGDRRAGD
ncbi:MAG: copper resistance protein CopC [Microbacterium sp.]|uniref:copper resistance CopC family protein n=1 Tax=Microbacterium sp. TaxID=51671 RepID=UPI003A894F9A